MRPFTLTAIKTGISRQRVKGGARPDALYDLINAQLNAAMEIVPRPGTMDFDTISYTGDPVISKGLAYFRGKYHVFSAHFGALDNTGVVLHVLPHPDDPDQEIKEVHTSEPFLGYLFVVVEFENGDVRYFWLTEGEDGGEAWKASHVYIADTMVSPTDPNGFFYRATRLTPAGDTWKPSEEKALNDVVEPTIYDGFTYTAVDVYGDNPRTGTEEPSWNAVDGGLTYEFADEGTSGGGTPPPTGNPPVPPDVPGRYGGTGGTPKIGQSKL